MISHYSLVANLVQLGQYLRLTDDNFPAERKRYKPGDVALGSASIHFPFAGMTLNFVDSPPAVSCVFSGKLTAGCSDYGR